MFHKTRRLNHQLVKSKIKSTLLNTDAKVIQKNSMTLNCALLEFSTKIDLPSNFQTTKINKNNS